MTSSQRQALNARIAERWAIRAVLARAEERERKLAKLRAEMAKWRESDEAAWLDWIAPRQ